MDGYEPQMCNCGLEHRIDVAFPVEPFKKRVHFRFKFGCCRGLVVHTSTTLRAGDDPHRPGLIIAPCADYDALYATTCGWKQRRVPTEHSLVRQRLVIFLGRVEHHFDNAFDVSVCRRERPDVDAETAGDRGTNLIAIEDFTLDLTGLEDILGERVEHSLIAE